MNNENDEKSFWATLPGILTGIASVIGAIGVIYGVYVTRATVAPTATPTPTPTPTPSAAAPSTLHVASTSSFVTNDWFHIVGEVINNTSRAAKRVKIVATFYDEDGDFVDSDSTYTEEDVVPPGGRACFDMLMEANLVYHRYELVVESHPAYAEPQPTIELLSHAPSSGYVMFYVKGEVQNTGARSAEFVKVIGTFYDAAGNVIACDSTYTEVDVLSPGQKSPFDMGVLLHDYLDHYDLAIQAHFVD